MAIKPRPAKNQENQGVFHFALLLAARYSFMFMHNKRPEHPSEIFKYYFNFIAANQSAGSTEKQLIKEQTS